MARPAVLKGKKTLEHFGVKLEDTGDSQEQPILPHFTKGQNLQGMYSGPSRTYKERGSSTSNTCDDFTIIT
ncbi:hypothetical protein Tco_1223312 [Tanacetum coccineum]